MSDAWARSGAMWLTGRKDGPALDTTGDPAGIVEQALVTLSAGRIPQQLDSRLLGERAALAKLTRSGSTTAGGAGRLLATDDGWLALSLARPSDLDLVPALIEGTPDSDAWTAVAAWAQHHSTAEAEERAVLLGLPAAAVPTRPTKGRAGVLVTEGGGPTRLRQRRRVLDLSSLWAGPLCAHLLGLLGADVVKVESTRRPDGARRGHPRFYDLLHAGQRSVAFDFTTDDGRAALQHLIGRADVVIEASRPRALRHLDVDAEAAVAAGTTWVAITAYGRSGDGALRVGFGDDVAAGAGLVARDDQGPVFAGDALADPLTGVLAAAAVATRQDSLTAALIDVSMHDLAVEVALATAPAAATSAARPWHRPVTELAATLGAHTRQVLEEW